MERVDDVSRALIIYDDYKHFNKLKKKLKGWNVFRKSDYDNGIIKLPAIDKIFIIGLSDEENKWRRILYRKGISIQVEYISEV